MSAVKSPEEVITDNRLRRLSKAHRELGQRALTKRNVSVAAINESWQELKPVLDGVHKKRITIDGLVRYDRVEGMTGLLPSVDSSSLELHGRFVSESHARTLIGQERTVVYWMPLDIEDGEIAREPKDGKIDAAHMMLMLCANPDILKQPRPDISANPVSLVPSEDLQWSFVD